MKNFLKRLFWEFMVTFDPYWNDIYSAFDSFEDFFVTRL